jgi:hypothetical protein
MGVPAPRRQTGFPEPGFPMPKRVKSATEPEAWFFEKI